jgi:hypothetical protein
MSWQEFSIELVERIGLGGILGAAVGALVTLIVKDRLDRKAESRWRIEELNVERQRRVDEWRVNVLSSVYAALYDMHIALEHYATPNAAGDEESRRADSFSKAANDFRTNWQHGRFWFDDSTGALLDETWQLYREAGFALEDPRTELNPQGRQMARSLLKTKMPEARQTLERIPKPVGDVVI